MGKVDPTWDAKHLVLTTKYNPLVMEQKKTSGTCHKDHQKQAIWWLWWQGRGESMEIASAR